MLARLSLGVAIACASAVCMSSGTRAAVVEAQAQPEAGVNPAALGDPAAVPPFGSVGGCVKIDRAAGSGRRPPPTFGQLACAAAIAPATRELRIDRAETSWRLGFVGGDERRVGEVRGLFSFEHAVASGPLAGWQLHADILVGRLAGANPDSLIDEQMHVALSRGLPAGWNLRLDAGTTARGALDPAAAIELRSEFAAVLSWRFRLPLSDAEHRFGLRIADQTAANRLSGTEQRTMLSNVEYAHKLDGGSVGADLAFSRTEAAGLRRENSARTRLKFSHRF